MRCSVIAAIALSIALLACAVPASALPLALFPTSFPEACAHERLVFGPSDSIWFLARACERHEESGVWRLPIDDPKPQLVRRLKQPTNDLTVGPEGNVWFTEGSAIDQGELPEIGRLTPAGQLTQFPGPVQPNLPYTFHEAVDQILAGPEGDLWFIAEAVGANILARITPTGALAQFPAPLVKRGPGAPEPKPDEVPRALATAANGNLWMSEEFKEGTIGLVGPGGAIKQVRVAENHQGVITEGDPMVGTADGGLWFREAEAFTLVGPEGHVLSRVPEKEGVGRFFAGTLATTPDGVLWASEQEAGDVLKRVTPAGELGDLIFCSSNETPVHTTVGPEGDLWFSAQTGKDFGRLDLPQLTSELERERTQVRICAAKATPRTLRAKVACESLNVSNSCDYQATVTLAHAPSHVLGTGRFLGKALHEPGQLTVPLRPVVRALLHRHRRLLLRLTLRTGAHIAASSLVTLRG